MLLTICVSVGILISLPVMPAIVTDNAKAPYFVYVLSENSYKPSVALSAVVYQFFTPAQGALLGEAQVPFFK